MRDKENDFLIYRAYSQIFFASPHNFPPLDPLARIIHHHLDLQFAANQIKISCRAEVKLVRGVVFPHYKFIAPCVRWELYISAFYFGEKVEMWNCDPMCGRPPLFYIHVRAFVGSWSAAAARCGKKVALELLRAIQFCWLRLVRSWTFDNTLFRWNICGVTLWIIMFTDSNLCLLRFDPQISFWHVVKSLWKPQTKHFYGLYGCYRKFIFIAFLLQFSCAMTLYGYWRAAVYCIN